MGLTQLLHGHYGTRWVVNITAVRVLLSQPNNGLYIMCQTPSKRRTDGRRAATHLFVRPSVLPFVRSFVCLFVRCVCHGRPSYGE